MSVSPDVLIVLLATAAQIGMLIKFMMKWEGRMSTMETVLSIVAAKHGIPYNGNGAKEAKQA